MSWCCEHVFSSTQCQCLFCGLNYSDGFTFGFTSHLHSLGMNSIALTILKSLKVLLPFSCWVGCFQNVVTYCEVLSLTNSEGWEFVPLLGTERIHNLDKWVCSLKCEDTGSRSEWSCRGVGMQVMECEWKALSNHAVCGVSIFGTTKITTSSMLPENPMIWTSGFVGGKTEEQTSRCLGRRKCGGERLV